MAYLLNGINISTYGITPGHAPASNISLAECFDMPARTGKCFHSWDDEDSIEPYTAAGDLFFEGRDIVFTGAIFGTNTVINNYLKALYTAIEAFTTAIIFSTPYGEFTGYVKSVTPEIINGGAAKVQMIFREPVVTLTGTLPAVSVNTYTIDGIPFSSFGLYLSKDEALHALPELKEQLFTKYGSEGYQIVKRQNKTLDINGFIVADYVNSLLTDGSEAILTDSGEPLFIEDLSQLKSKLQYLFSSSGTRNIKLRDEVNIECFAIDGFKIENALMYNDKIIANFIISLLCANVNYLNELLTEEGSENILTMSDEKILI